MTTNKFSDAYLIIPMVLFAVAFGFERLHLNRFVGVGRTRAEKVFDVNEE